MSILEIGKPFLGKTGPCEVGVQLVMGDSSPQLQMFLGNLSQAEIDCICKGPCYFGVAEVGPILFFMYRFDPLFGWSDCPYHRSLEEAFRPVHLTPLTAESRALLQVVLVSAEDSVVRGLRAVTLDPAVTAALWRAVRKQGDLPADYDLRLQEAYTRYDSNALGRMGLTCKGGA